MIPTLDDLEKENFWKHKEKEKMLVNSTFPFSHNVFYQFQKEFMFLSYICFVNCKCLRSGPA